MSSPVSPITSHLGRRSTRQPRSTATTRPLCCRTAATCKAFSTHQPIQRRPSSPALPEPRTRICSLPARRRRAGAGGCTGATGSMNAPARKSRHPPRSAAIDIPRGHPRLALTYSIETANPLAPAAVMSENESDMDRIDVRLIDVDGQTLRVGIKHGPIARPPLLLFNGIGANLELAQPFMCALKQTKAIIFDIPGVGGSPLPSLPYRPSTIARLSMRLIERIGHQQVDVAGVSWGGGLAQQFAHQHSDACRKLVLAATSPGAIMVPGSPRVLWKLATPRRYLDRGFLRRVAPQIYGGAFRDEPELINKHADAMSGASNIGYLYQLLAMAGWTSLPWLWSLKQPTLILAGRDDPIVPALNGRIMVHIMQNARLEIIDDGHLFMLTQPAQTAAIIESFLAK